MPDYRDRPPVDEPRLSWRDIRPLDVLVFGGLAAVGCVCCYAFAIMVGCA